jgi:hypothetical protein
MSDRPYAISRKLTDLSPEIAVEVDPTEAERLGAFREVALDDDAEDEADGE